MGCVYLIRNDFNHKVYIGKHIGKPLNRYIAECFHLALNKKSNAKPVLYRAIRKYGKENFTVFPLIESDSESALFGWEKYFIAEYESNSPEIGYNLTSGGEGASFKHAADCGHCLWLKNNRSKVGAHKGNIPWNKGLVGYKPNRRKAVWSAEQRLRAAERATKRFNDNPGLAKELSIKGIAKLAENKAAVLLTR
jgi:group I intron endonuclease